MTFGFNSQTSKNPESLKSSVLSTLPLHLNPSDSREALWKHEPQLALRDSALYFSRVLSLDDVNRHSVARYQPLTESTNLGLEVIAVGFTEQNDTLQLVSHSAAPAKAGELRVQVTALLLHTLARESPPTMYL